MRKRGRFGSLPCATIAGVTAALIGAAGLGAQSQSTQPENTLAPPVTYLWQGRIEVENDYNGEAGEHRWTAQYQVKFLEEQTSERHAYIDSFEVYELVPLELKYTIDARQDWDRAGVGRGADGQILSGPVRMHGQATGIISADQMKEYQFLSGDIGAIEAPADSASTNQRAFASDREYDEFWNNHRTSPGWYRLKISFGDGSAGEQRARYNGINRSGEQPIGDDPDVDFVSWVPNFMPAGTNVIGRLDTPDQTDVRGEISFRYRDDDPYHVKVKWNFVRCREGVPCPPPPSTDCHSTPESGKLNATLARDPLLYSAPSVDSPVLSVLMGGSRVDHRETRISRGEVWYFVDRDTQKGWGRADDFCGSGRPPRMPSHEDLIKLIKRLDTGYRPKTEHWIVGPGG